MSKDEIAFTLSDAEGNIVKISAKELIAAAQSGSRIDVLTRRLDELDKAKQENVSDAELLRLRACELELGDRLTEVRRLTRELEQAKVSREELRKDFAVWRDRALLAERRLADNKQKLSQAERDQIAAEFSGQLWVAFYKIRPSVAGPISIGKFSHIVNKIMADIRLSDDGPYRAMMAGVNRFMGYNSCLPTDENVVIRQQLVDFAKRYKDSE